MRVAICLLSLILAAGAVFAQDIALNPEHGERVAITQDTFLLRFQKHDFNATVNAGVASSCLIVYPDGKYRFEREHQEWNEKRQTAHVFEGQVDADSMAKLRQIVNNPDFRAVHVIPEGNMIVSNESYNVDVLRADGLQRFMITDDTRRQYNKALKPFVDWEHQLEKRKTPETKGAESNGCQFPRRVEMPMRATPVKDDDQ
jgi:hypothetical protein